mmetsp:Transcript_6213/g.9550  ORF Transcript_6213/g.9550 Transcript_6213/m.9550 type:complete len:718 (-) Transcript_6213:54-2207(-)
MICEQFYFLRCSAVNIIRLSVLILFLHSASITNGLVTITSPQGRYLAFSERRKAFVSHAEVGDDARLWNTEIRNDISLKPSSESRTPSRQRRGKGRNLSTHSIPQSAPLTNPLQSLNLNLNSLAKQASSGSSYGHGAAARAQELLQRIEALHNEGYYAVAPDVVSLNTVLNAWAQDESDPDATSKALKLLLSYHSTDEDEDDASDNKTKNKIKPDVISFNTLILAFAKRGAAKEARELLDQLQASEFHVEPNIISYNSVLYAYAIARWPEAAERLLKDMIASSSPQLLLDNDIKDIWANRTLTPKPDTHSFNTVLLAWARSNQWDDSKQRYRKSACIKAEELLWHMENLHGAGNTLVEPDIYSYTLVLQALSQSRRPRAANRAMKLLKYVELLAKEEGREHLRPNTVTYTNVITSLCHSSSPQAATQAEAILEKMIDRYEKEGATCNCIPDTVAFTAVITCWARGYEHNDGSDRALALMERMKMMGDVAPPNALTYTSVLKAMTERQTSASADIATSLLEEMIEAYQSGNTALEPTSIHYNVVLDVYAKSPHFDKAVRAYDLYQKMVAQNTTSTQANIVTYNSILRACANTFGSPTNKKKAREIAVKTFDKILKTCQPSSITFLFFFKALRKLQTTSTLEGKQWQAFVKTFQYCCQLGLVNDFVLDQAKRACRNTQQQRDLFSSLDKLHIQNFKDLKAVDLPSEWTKNASNYGVQNK